jgi:hypothetical protein
MKRTTLKTAAITTALASCFIFLSLHSVEAQSISGDDLCGSSSTAKCTPAALKTLGMKVLSLFTVVGSALLVVFIAIRVVMSWYAYRAGDAGAIKRAGQQAFNAFIGFIIVFAVFGGVFMILLNTLGAQPWVGKLLQMFSEAFVPQAYAAGTQLPNPLGSNSLYDILISAASLALRFFVYPAVIAMWVWSGFQFVYSQGNPEGLNKAKSWLFWAFIITVITFALQGFLLAFRGTAEKIVPGVTNLNLNNTATPSSPTATTTTAQPAAGTYGASCTVGSFYGTIGTDGTCKIGGSR